MRRSIAACPSSISRCPASPSTKYIGGLNIDAAIPIIRTLNCSAIWPATSSKASFGRSTARLTMAVAYVIILSRVVKFPREPLAGRARVQDEVDQFPLVIPRSAPDRPRSFVAESVDGVREVHDHLVWIEPTPGVISMHPKMRARRLRVNAASLCLTLELCPALGQIVP